MEVSSLNYLEGLRKNLEHKCNHVKIPRAASGDTYSDGMLGMMRETEKVNGVTKERLAFRVDWLTGGTPLEDEAMVQNFLQWPDPNEPGKFLQVTCNARYRREAIYGFSSMVRIENLHSMWDITTRNLPGNEASAAISPHQIEKVHWEFDDLKSPPEMEFFTKDMPGALEQTYASSFAFNKAWQRCGAEVRLEGYDGYAYTNEALQLHLKYGIDVSYMSGFRIWSYKEDDYTFREADAPQGVQYDLWKLSDSANHDLDNVDYDEADNWTTSKCPFSIFTGAIWPQPLLPYNKNGYSVGVIEE